MSMLDHSKPFQQFFPPHEGATFEQDGQRFDGEGRPLAATGEKKAAGKPGKPGKPGDAAKTDEAKPGPAADPSQAQLDQQLAG